MHASVRITLRLLCDSLVLGLSSKLLPRAVPYVPGILPAHTNNRLVYVLLNSLLCDGYFTTAIRLRFDGRSTTIRLLIKSKVIKVTVRLLLAAVTLTYLFIKAAGRCRS